MSKLQPYKIFLDDERFPGKDLQDVVIVRDYWEFKRVLVDRGIPEYITFDHDLGFSEYTGKSCAAFLTFRMIDEELPASEVKKFRFDVHSQNPVGAENIRKFLNAWLEELSTEG